MSIDLGVSLDMRNVIDCLRDSIGDEADAEIRLLVCDLAETEEITLEKVKYLEAVRIDTINCARMFARGEILSDELFKKREKISNAIESCKEMAMVAVDLANHDYRRMWWKDGARDVVDKTWAEWSRVAHQLVHAHGCAAKSQLDSFAINLWESSLVSDKDKGRIILSWLDRNNVRSVSL